MNKCCSQANSEQVQGKGSSLRVMQQQDRLPREAVGSLSLDILAGQGLEQPNLSCKVVLLCAVDWTR